MSWRQLLVFCVAMSIMVAGLIWFFGSREATQFHFMMRDYLEKHDKFREWEAGGGSST